MSAASAAPIAHVTSGLGPRHGGIGTLAALVRRGLLRRRRVVEWPHHHRWPRPARLAATVGQAWLGALAGPPALVVYDHAGLARLHALVPPLRGVPYLVFLNGEEAWTPVEGRMRRAFAEAARVVAISHATYAQARAANPWLGDVVVAPPGVPVGAEVVGDRQPWAVVVSRMQRVARGKELDAVLDAWKSVRAAVPPARLFMVGDGDDRRRLEARVRAEGIGGVEFTGFVGDARRDALYRSAALLLFPSRQEGFGLAAAEAAAAGAAVLALRGTVLEELFPDGSACFVDEATGAAIAGAAVPLLADPARAAALGLRGRRRVEEHYREEHFLDRLDAVLAPLLP